MPVPLRNDINPEITRYGTGELLRDIIEQTIKQYDDFSSNPAISRR